jgi:hypothetical protein
VANDPAFANIAKFLGIVQAAPSKQAQQAQQQQQQQQQQALRLPVMAIHAAVLDEQQEAQLRRYVAHGGALPLPQPPRRGSIKQQLALATHARLFGCSGGAAAGGGALEGWAAEAATAAGGGRLDPAAWRSVLQRPQLPARPSAAARLGPLRDCLGRAVLAAYEARALSLQKLLMAGGLLKVRGRRGLPPQLPAPACRPEAAQARAPLAPWPEPCQRAPRAASPQANSSDMDASLQLASIERSLLLVWLDALWGCFLEDADALRNKAAVRASANTTPIQEFRWGARRRQRRARARRGRLRLRLRLRASCSPAWRSPRLTLTPPPTHPPPPPRCFARQDGGQPHLPGAAGRVP